MSDRPKPPARSEDVLLALAKMQAGLSMEIGGIDLKIERSANTIFGEISSILDAIVSLKEMLVVEDDAGAAMKYAFEELTDRVDTIQRMVIRHEERIEALERRSK